MRVEWTLNPQYNYGWGVPFLALLLFYFRWQRRPAPDIGARNNALITVSMAFTLALLFPIRVIEEANPDWRFLSWVLAFCVIDFSLLSLLRAGGARWLKHFAFPICFPLAAVPWPVQFENVVVQTMMRAVAYGQAFQGKKVYGALYGPWVKILDPAGTGPNPFKWVPPAGHVMGVYARIESSRGIWKAPASTISAMIAR